MKKARLPVVYITTKMPFSLCDRLPSPTRCFLGYPKTWYRCTVDHHFNVTDKPNKEKWNNAPDHVVSSLRDHSRAIIVWQLDIHCVFLSTRKRWLITSNMADATETTRPIYKYNIIIRTRVDDSSKWTMSYVLDIFYSMWYSCAGVVVADLTMSVWTSSAHIHALIQCCFYVVPAS